MQKAGGIIGLISGIMGILAALVTLSVGGLGSAFDADGSGTVVGLGWGGLAFSFLVIVFGAVAMGSNSRLAGALLTLCAIAGAIVGGTFVAVFMVLAFIGGLIAVMGKRREGATSSA